MMIIHINTKYGRNWAYFTTWAMFKHCWALNASEVQEIIGNWKAPKLVNMESMFAAAHGMKGTLSLPNFDPILSHHGVTSGTVITQTDYYSNLRSDVTLQQSDIPVRDVQGNDINMYIFNWTGDLTVILNQKMSDRIAQSNLSGGGGDEDNNVILRFQ